MALPRNSGPVVIGGKLVIALFVVLSDGLRLRVGVEDWGQLGLHDGEGVCVSLPGERVGREYLLRSSLWVETWYWLELAAVTGRRDAERSRRGDPAPRPAGPNRTR